MENKIQRADVKQCYDRAIAYGAEDAAEMLLALAQYADDLEKEHNDFIKLLSDCKLFFNEFSYKLCEKDGYSWTDHWVLNMIQLSSTIKKVAPDA